ncbi:MAG TPA: response regulator [Candidatus Acidoferrales bacterium]|nr:response regulator [Candidatus Acidoferrales bacterium]
MRKDARRPEKTGNPNGKSADSKQMRLEFRRAVSRAPGYVFQYLLDRLEVGVAHADRHGVILYANPRFAEIFGQSIRRVISANLKQFISAGSWMHFATAMKRGAEDFAEGMISVVADDHSPERVIRLSFSPVAVGEVNTIGIVATEVTELMKTSNALKQSEASLKSLSARLLQIQDEERRRVARDLHDTTGQELSVLIISLDRLAKQLAKSPGDVQKTANYCVERLRKMENDVRTLSYVLHPPLLDEMGLGTALGWFLDGYQKRTGIKVEREIPESVPRFSLEKETALFRVIQECLTNVYRHSGSKFVHVRLAVGPHWIEASVQDRGKGFAHEALPQRPKSGVGIQSMRGRLEMVGGTFEISSDTQGTRVAVTIPVELDEVLDSQQEPQERDEGRREAEKHMRRRILVADDHQVARRGIRTLFEGQPDLEICGEAADGLEALERTKELKPDLVILDLNMPKMGGLTAANHIRNAGLGTKILVYTGHSYPQLEKTAIAAGCDGYVVKSAATTDLVRATRTVLNGGKFYQAQTVNAQSA